MRRKCAVSGIDFEISEADLEFYRRLQVPPPTLSPVERQRRRIAIRNFRSLYYRYCSATGKRTLSMYSQEVPFPVFQYDAWWSDNWDGRSFGRDFDFRRPFFEQFSELARVVPHAALHAVNCENSSFCNFALNSRNCYLVFGCVDNEDCLYGHIVWHSKSCVDNLYLHRCELCSNSIDLVDCYNVHYSSESSNCSDSYFLHDCAGCRDCFACYNQRNKQYCFYNETLTKEQYQANMARILPLGHEAIEDATLWLESEKKSACVYPESFSLRNEAVSGNHIYESNKVWDSFDVKSSEESRFCYTGQRMDHCYDQSFMGGACRFSIECVTCPNCENLKFCHLVHNSHDVSYSEFCYSSHDLFGCIGLRNAEYCILNRQYSKEEYLKILPRIVKHMSETGEYGEFFPARMSPFAYNESIANEYMPLSRDEVLRRGLKWRENSDEESATKVERTAAAPEGDSVLTRVFTCAESGKPFKIQKQEWEFYQRLKLPLPKLCPDKRHLNRMAMRSPRELFDYNCARCGRQIKTSITAAQSHSVMCEECYRQAL